MIPENGQSEPRRCPVCEEGFLHLRMIDERYNQDDGGQTVTIETKNVPIEDCDSCGESFSGPIAIQIRHEALGRALGLLNPAEIIAIRESHQSTPAEFAKKLGVSEQTLTLWEKGRAWQDRIADNFLRVLSNQPTGTVGQPLASNVSVTDLKDLSEAISQQSSYRRPRGLFSDPGAA
jgi:DNA-binding transcriptional regulator YiaG